MTKLERIILNTSPLQFLLGKTKKWCLPGFEKVSLYDVGAFFFQQIKKTGLTERAAAISYNFIMAIPPTCLFLFTLIPNLPFIPKRNLKIQLHLLIRDIIPATAHNSDLIKFVDSFLDEPRIGLLSFGFVLLIFFASNGMMGIMRSFNKNYIGFERRSGLQARWTAIKLTTLVMGLVLAYFLMLLSQVAFLKWMGIKSKTFITTIRTVRWVFIIGLVFYSIAFVYKYAPAISKRWRLVSPGSIFATTLSILTNYLFALFVNNFGRYNALYGSIGTIIVLMTVIYLNSLVLLIGYELNVSIHSLKAMAEEREKQPQHPQPV